MTDVERRSAAAKFAADWRGRGDEKQETQAFWLALLQKVYGVDEPEKYIQFELPVKIDHTSFIDCYIPETRVLIEQKSMDIDLNRGYKQSDGSILKPYAQARRYGGYLPHNQNPRWIVVCNFQEFQIHDMNRPNDEPEIILLADLDKEFAQLDFLADTGKEHIKREMRVSLQAGELVGVLYDALLKQYKDPNDPEALKSLNKLCVRLVFCLYAEDAGIFGSKSMFHDYLEKHRSEDRRALINLFRVLDQDIPQRDEYMDDDLAAFPYVNGGLFADEDIKIPRLGDEVIDLILHRASEDFDWSEISPTIFGAVFESTLNPETRRSGGMHYTSIENIHKVIDPLFLDELKREYRQAMDFKTIEARKNNLKKLQDKIASLKFLDPACGSGNFLTETYLSLRRMENQIILSLTGNAEGQIGIMGGDFANPVQVSIGQFYGIEINDFAVTVAKTALWIAESQMLKQTEDIIHRQLDFLPLKSYANIIEGNALRVDWESVVSKCELNYIMGNPPFVGARMMAQGSQQKCEVQSIFGDIKDVQDLDYVTCWYKIAAQTMSGTNIEAAFVSTNSVSQGSQVPILWNVLLNEYHVHINFAHRTFKWNSESANKAAVHCVIIGFSCIDRKTKTLFSQGVGKQVENISPYLVEGGDYFVTAQKQALCNVPKMSFGNQPRDGGHLVISSDERAELLKREPTLAKWLHPYIGAEEFINKKERWCLWLKGISPAEIKGSKAIYEKVEAVRQFRLASKAKTTNGYAKVPHLFAQITQPDNANYLIVPRVSSERRRYAPIGFMNANVISSDAVQIVPNATLYHFGVLTSNVHMAWMRAVCGRLKSDYRYSKELVYNPFPWPAPTNAQKAKIEQTAQAILDARALYPDSSLADLYDETTMPVELRRAHQNNDRAVMQAYGFKVGDMTESQCVAELMRMYQALTNQK
ncbi:MAG: class I SAM-dependent DNA methyltransferase [Clostridiales bacterium]|nr:class I SAM-dependent DNA methyltransferase [Clostridiales bacterium]